MADAKKITKLLKEGKLGEAQRAISDYIKEVEVSDTEAGSVYLELSSLYLQLSNAILREQVELMEEIAKEMRDLQMKKQILAKK